MNKINNADSSFMYEKIFASPFVIAPFCSKIFDQCCSLLVAVVHGCHEASVEMCDFLMWNYVMQQCQFDCVCMVYITQNWIQLHHKWEIFHVFDVLVKRFFRWYFIACYTCRVVLSLFLLAFVFLKQINLQFIELIIN